MSSLRLTTDQIAAIKASGGRLTFSPRARNKVVCNQAPGLGRMSPKQAHRLAAQVWSRKPARVVLRVVADAWADFNCPHCSAIRFAFTSGRRSCADCEGTFDLVIKSTI